VEELGLRLDEKGYMKKQAGTMRKRASFLDRVDFVNRLQQVNEHRRAALLLRDTNAEIDRLYGDMRQAERMGGGLSAQERARILHGIKALHIAAHKHTKVLEKK
jgi:predicted ATP-dependent protease